MSSNNTNLKDVLTSKEVSFIMSIAAVTLSIGLFLTGADWKMKSDIALIKKDIQVIRANELKHLQEKIDSCEEADRRQDEKLGEINDKLTQILIILGE